MWFESGRILILPDLKLQEIIDLVTLSLSRFKGSLMSMGTIIKVVSCGWFGTGDVGIVVLLYLLVVFPRDRRRHSLCSCA